MFLSNHDLFCLDGCRKSNGFRYFEIVRVFGQGRGIAFTFRSSSGHLDNYVQNIHLLHQPSSPSPTSSRPKRIRKRKIFFSEESETINRPKKFKSVLQKTRPSAPPPLVPLTDAEIEQQFGERLPVIKTEHHEDLQPIIPTQTRIEYEPIPRTPIEKARAKLTTALGRRRRFLMKNKEQEFCTYRWS